MPKDYYRGRFFGDLRSIGDRPEQMMRVRSWSRRLYFGARSHLCPIPNEVAEYYGQKWKEKHPRVRNETRIRREGRKMTVKRYMECNFVLKWNILEQIRNNNHNLYQKMIEPVGRIPGEKPDQNLRAEFLPPDFNKKMRLASTVYGYALPRIWLVGAGEKRDERTAIGIDTCLRIVDELSRRGDVESPIEFMVLMAEQMADEGADSKRILYHMLSVDLLKEEGCKTMFGEVLETMREKAPVLNNVYSIISEEERTAMGIIDPTDLK